MGENVGYNDGVQGFMEDDNAGYEADNAEY